MTDGNNKALYRVVEGLQKTIWAINAQTQEVFGLHPWDLFQEEGDGVYSIVDNGTRFTLQTSKDAQHLRLFSL